MTPTQKAALDSIVNRSIKYRSKNYQIKQYKIVNSLLVVITNSTSFNFLPPEVDPFLNELVLVEDDEALSIWKPKEDKLPAQNNQTKVNLAIFEPTESQKAIQNSLIEMLAKVKDDPKSIPQAKAVVDIANAMVNMEKTQIQFINSVRKIR